MGGSSLPPSSYAQFHISADLPPPLTPSPSLRFLPRLLFIPCCSAHIGPVSGCSLHSHLFSRLCPSAALFAFSHCSLSSFSSPLTLIKICSLSISDYSGQGQCLFTATATGPVSFLLMASEVSPLSAFLFIPAGGTVHTGHSTYFFKKRRQFSFLKEKLQCVGLTFEKGYY